MAEYVLDKEKQMRVLNLIREYNTYVNGSSAQEFYARMERNFRMYSGVNNGQWTRASVEVLKKQQRPVHTFNFAQGKVKSILGQLQQNPFEVYFEPTELGSVEEEATLQNLYEYDYERGNYESSEQTMLRDGLILQGVLKMFVDYKTDPLGNVGLKNVNPFHIAFDPYWASNDMNDCRGVFESTWMTASQIERDYSKNSELIKSAIKRDNFRSIDDEQINKVADRSPEFYNRVNSQYKVIEFVYTQKQSKRRVFNVQTGQFDKSFEDAKYKNLTDENFTALMRIQGNALRLKREQITVVKTITICPALGNDLILSEGYYPIQIGRLPYFVFSAENIYGEKQGIIDLIYDAQEVLNKRESVATQILSMQGSPNYFGEEGAFIDEKEKNRFKRESTKGGQYFEFAEGGINKLTLQDRGRPPTELWNASDRAERHITELSGVVNASVGKSEHSNESGLLFNAKREQSLVILEGLNRSIKYLKQEIGEAYFYASKQIYAGPERLIKNKKRDKLLKINELAVDENGMLKIINDISKIQRHDILVKEAPMGTSKKREFLSKYIELSRTITNPMVRAMIEPAILKYADLPESIMQKIEPLSDKFIELQQAQADLQIKTANQQIKQLEPQKANTLGDTLGTMDAQDISKLPGLGNLPNNAGISGGESATNNAKGSAPSDIGRR